jgi:hypothetical protein
MMLDELLDLVEGRNPKRPHWRQPRFRRKVRSG